MLISKENARFRAVRASGPGGQRTNRRSTKVQLWVKISNLPLSEREKKLIRKKLPHHVNGRDEIEVVSEEERSQELNRDRALAKLNQLIAGALKTKKPRIPTRPPRRAEDRRIKEKRIVSDKKKSRRVR